MRKHRRRAPPPRSTRPRRRPGRERVFLLAVAASVHADAAKELGLTHAAHANVVHHQIATFEFETVLASGIARAERGGKVPVVGFGGHDRRVRAFVPEVQQRLRGDGRRTFRGFECESLFVELGDDARLEFGDGGGDVFPRAILPSVAAKGLCASATTSAMPMPYADRMPQNLCTKTVRMPRDRAMAHACCGPAPPKAARTCDAVSKPLLSVISRIGRHIASFATRRYPSATSSVVRGTNSDSVVSACILSSASLMRTVSSSNTRLAASASRGWSSLSPKILGKYGEHPTENDVRVRDGQDSPPLR